MKRRELYYKLKDRNISVLQVHRFLKQCNISISQRTLQDWLDQNYCKDEVVEKVIKKVISNHDRLIKSLKEISNGV